MFMTVVVDGVTYVADRGFGLSAPRVPVPLVDSLVDQTTNRMQCDGNFWVLHVARVDRQPLAGCASTLEVKNPWGFDVFNHYTATHPESPLPNWIFLSAVTPEGWAKVINRNVMLLRRADPSIVTHVGDRTGLLEFSLASVGKLPAELGLTPQQLLNRPYERDRAAIETLEANHLPAIGQTREVQRHPRD